MADTCVSLSSFLNGGHLHMTEIGGDISVQVCMCRQTHTYTDEDSGESSVVNGITAS